MSSGPREAPRAFVSHATEDKASYARPLAEGLVAIGVDAWLDEWEMHPGDSLIQKIFSEGIRGTDAVVVVLSAVSIAKPWVQKELNVAAVKNIQNATRLIPVRTDTSDVPEVLCDLYWIDWHREGSAQEVARRIADTLFSVSKKPALGTPPPHLATPSFTIPGLSPRDVKVLEIIFEASLRNRGVLIQADTIMPIADAAGISFDEVKESIEILDHEGFVSDEDRTLAGRFIVVKFNPFHHLKVAESLGWPLDQIMRKTVAALVNRQANSLFDLKAEQEDVPTAILESIIRVLEANGFWRRSGTLDGNSHVHGVSVKARRWLEGQS